jgi:hypothetical protein
LEQRTQAWSRVHGTGNKGVAIVEQQSIKQQRIKQESINQQTTTKQYFKHRMAKPEQ